MFLGCTKKEPAVTYTPAPADHYILCVGDKINNTKNLDTIVVVVNRKRVGANYTVHFNDSVRVYYNPGSDTSGIKKNNLRITYDGDNYLVKEYNCNCITDYTFIVVPVSQ